MSIHTRAYHVLVPSTLTYWVEADSEEEARLKVGLSIAGTPVCNTVAVVKVEQTPVPSWDVEDPSDHGECGCDQCVGHYDHDD